MADAPRYPTMLNGNDPLQRLLDRDQMQLGLGILGAMGVQPGNRHGFRSLKEPSSVSYPDKTQAVAAGTRGAVPPQNRLMAALSGMARSPQLARGLGMMSQGIYGTPPQAAMGRYNAMMEAQKRKDEQAKLDAEIKRAEAVDKHNREVLKQTIKIFEKDGIDPYEAAQISSMQAQMAKGSVLQAPEQPDPAKLEPMTPARATAYLAQYGRNPNPDPEQRAMLEAAFSVLNEEQYDPATGRSYRRTPPQAHLAWMTDEEKRRLESPQNIFTEKTTAAALENIRRIEGQLNSLDASGATYSADYLQYVGRARTFLGNILSKIGVAAGERNAARRLVSHAGDAAEFFRGVEEFFNEYRKYVTGAQASFAELEALKKATINGDISPVQFERRFQSLYNKLLSDLEVEKKRMRDGLYTRPAPWWEEPKDREGTAPSLGKGRGDAKSIGQRAGDF